MLRVDCPKRVRQPTELLPFDSGPPLVPDEPAASYERASDEHGRLGIAGATNRLNIGDKVRLIPGHCDPTFTPTLPPVIPGSALGGEG